MFHNQGKALVEVWIGRAAVNVGDVTGQDMYDVMQNDIHQLCPGDGSAGSSCIWRNGKYPTHHVEEVKSKPNEPWVIRDCEFGDMKYPSGKC
jgi:Trm5-related predicted tRNA methylase